MTQIDTILILREAGGLGDVVMTEPVVRGLRAKHPRARLVYAGLPEYEPVVRLFGTAPDCFLPVTRAMRRGRDETPDPARFAYLRAGLRGDGRIVDLFCPAFRHEKMYAERTYKSRVELFCEAAGVAPLTPTLRIPARLRHWARGWLSGAGITTAPVALAPRTCGRRREWPLDKWAELARRLIRDGIPVLVLHHTRAPVRSVPGIPACGLSIERAAAVLATCRLAVVHDSGALHLAAALNVPTVSLWGSTHPAVTLRGYPRARAVWHADTTARPEHCRAPCYGIPGACDFEQCKDSCAILGATEVETVRRAVMAAGFSDFDSDHEADKPKP